MPVSDRCPNSSRFAGFKDYLAAKTYLEEFNNSDQVDQGASIEEIIRLREAVADIVLSAESSDDVLTAVDEAVESDAYARSIQLVTEYFGRIDIRHRRLGPTAEILECRETLFGSEVAAELNAADAAWIQFLQKAIAYSISAPNSTTLLSCGSIREAVENSGIPAEIRQCFISAWRSTVALTVVQVLVERETQHAFVQELARIAKESASEAMRIFDAEWVNKVQAVHEGRERWLAKAFDRAAAGDGYLEPFKTAK